MIKQLYFVSSRFFMNSKNAAVSFKRSEENVRILRVLKVSYSKQIPEKDNYNKFGRFTRINKIKTALNKSIDASK